MIFKLKGKGLWKTLTTENAPIEPKKAAYDKKVAEQNKQVKKRSSDPNLLDKASKKSTPQKNEKEKKKRSVGLSSLDAEEFEANKAIVYTTEEEDTDQEKVADQEETEIEVTKTIYFVKSQSVEKQSLLRWIGDSGTTKHMGANKSYFTEIRPIPNKTYIKVGNGTKIEDEEVGDVILHLMVKELDKPPRYRKVIVRDVLFVPKLMKNLLSISQFGDLGITTTFKGRRSDNEPLRGTFFNSRTNQVVATSTL